MRKAIAASAVATAIAMVIALFSSHGAGAFPAAAPLDQTAVAASTVQPAYYARHGRHRYVKCYHELIIGPYECHHYRYW